MSRSAWRRLDDSGSHQCAELVEFGGEDCREDSGSERGEVEGISEEVGCHSAMLGERGQYSFIIQRISGVSSCDKSRTMVVLH